jgi:hypothetical protein
MCRARRKVQKALASCIEPSPPGALMLALSVILRNAVRRAEVRSLGGCLALDALHLLARDVDCSGELIGFDQPALDHILYLGRSEAQILGRFRYCDFVAVFVIHPKLTSSPENDWGRDIA